MTNRRKPLLPLRSGYELDLVIENISNDATPSARVVLRIGNELRPEWASSRSGTRKCPMGARQVVCDLGSIDPGASTNVFFHGRPGRPGRTALDVSVVGRITNSDGTSDALRLVHTISPCTVIGTSSPTGETESLAIASASLGDDAVRCGSGWDRRVARDCERVVRR